MSTAGEPPAPTPREEPEVSLTFGEWLKSPEGQARILAQIRERLAPDYQPTSLERAFEEAGRQFWRRQRTNIEAEAVLRPYLAKAGWFLAGSFLADDVGVLANHVRQGDLASAEALMLEFARREVDRVERAVTEDWVARAAILRDAFAAHREGRYALSVPVFLTQADGISADILGVSLFRRDRPNREVPSTRRAYRDRLEDHRDPGKYPWTMLFGPLEVVCSWSESFDHWRESRASDPHYGPLNRHGVLHGLDLEYPTEANSLRAILLLEYVAGIGAWLRDG